MHDTIIMKDIIEQAKKQGEVQEIVIEVGRLSPIEADHLKEHLKELVDWKITVNEIKAKTNCECGFKGEPEIINRGHDFVLYKCPWCGDVPKIESGDKIILKEVKCA